MLKYDDASWHSGENFPEDVPRKNCATHIGMFLSWCMENNLISDSLKEKTASEIEKLIQRKITGAEFILTAMDGKLSESDLNNFGNSFAKDYYADDTDFGNQHSSFADDYINLFDTKAEQNGESYKSFYHIEDTHENYFLMRQMIDYRFEEWKVYKNLN